ncbi:MAG TPA: NACHT domain-containing protein, partial [Caldilineaceae bacterium]|nr:NACHT domain-containing protein [Caldilineaceae bacterium]
MHHRYPERTLITRQIPQHLTPLVARTTDIKAVSHLLADPACRLLTIVGPGGIGKTRLSIAVAADQWARVQEEADESFVHGIFFVSLQGLESAELLAPAIADAVGCPPANQESPQRQLLNFVSNKAMLIVLDSYDELLANHDSHSDGLDLLTTLLQVAPYVKLLITSREALHLQEEWLYPLSGLTYPALPQPGEPETTPADLERYSAIQLFVQAARRVQPEFDLSQEWSAILQICRLVEGLPLALELAASWVRALSCTEIAREIERSIDFLATQLRNVPDRHRSMLAVFTQTWQMLSPNERNVYKRLAVFRQGFRRQAAEAVAGATLPLLSALVSKSLLRWDSNGRYQLHSLLRHFAEEQLNEDSQVAMATLDAHAAYFVHFLQARTAEVTGARQREVLLEIDAELENIR